MKTSILLLLIFAPVLSTAHSLQSDCDMRLLGRTAALSSSESSSQFLNLAQIYFDHIGKRADTVVSALIDSPMPINPVKAATNTSDLQFRAAFSKSILQIDPNEWIAIQSGLREWQEKHQGIKADKAEKKEDTSYIAQLAHASEYRIQNGSEILAKIVSGDIGYVIVQQSDSSLLLAIDMKSGDATFIKIICERNCNPSFFTGSNGQVYLVTSDYKKFEISKVSAQLNPLQLGGEVEPFKSINTEMFYGLATTATRFSDGRIVLARKGSEKTEFYHFVESTHELILIGEIRHVDGIRWQQDFFSFNGHDYLLNITQEGSKVVLYEFTRDQILYVGRLAVTRPNRKEFRMNKDVHAFVRNGTLHIAFATSASKNFDFDEDQSILHVYDLGKAVQTKRSLLTLQKMIVAKEQTLKLKAPLGSSMALVMRGQRAVIATTDTQGLQVSEYTASGELRRKEMIESQFKELQVTQGTDIYGREFILTISDNRLNYYEVTSEGDLVVVDRYKLGSYDDRNAPLFLTGKKKSFVVLPTGGIEVLSTAKKIE